MSEVKVGFLRKSSFVVLSLFFSLSSFGDENKTLLPLGDFGPSPYDEFMKSQAHIDESEALENISVKVRNQQQKRLKEGSGQKKRTQTLN
jgi:hypothetical protein